MEPRFGYDFSRVRVHSGAAAEQSAKDVNAHAYTVAHDIVFGAARFNPLSDEGRRLLAHELTHVVQQSSGGPRLQRFVYCTPARLSMQDCPPRKPGEAEKARFDPMVFGDFNDPLESVSGALIFNFDIGSSAIKHNLSTNVDWGSFVRRIESNRSRWKIAGFTDCQGADTLNATLREQRAKTVFDILPSSVQALIDSHGAAPRTQCITDNASPADRTRNRSVLLQLVAYDADFSAKPYSVPPSSLEELDTDTAP